MNLKRLFVFTFAMNITLHAAQVCDLTLTACPKQLPSGTLQVPLDVISLDTHLPFCQETGVITSQVQPSIVFIIDNSGSMSMGDYDDNLENDPQEARFSVVSDLLSQINTTNPGAEVGIVAFSRRLQFDHRDNPLFKTAFPNDTSQHDSYVPLITLNQVFADGRTGLDTLRALLKHDTDGDMAYATTRPASRGSNDNLVNQTGGRLSMRPGTDITLGFEAAKLAIQTAKAPKANQYFIFLSDGEPGGLDSGRTAMRDDFIQGVNTPTTFTVYFTQGAGGVPTSIRNMTTNIQDNNFSATNPESRYFSVGTPATELQTLLQNSVLSRILNVPTQAQSVTLSVSGQTQSSTQRAADNGFLLSTRMPLQAGLTPVQFSYTHTFRDTTVIPAVNRDTVIAYSFNVQRQANAVLPANATKTCRDQADLSLYSGGQVITAVTANESQLEARLTPTTGTACTNCKVDIQPSASADLEKLNLVPTGNHVSATFVRLESLTPLAGDGILQHLSTDSLILTWVNPENSLDVVRRAYPFQSIQPTLGLFYGGVEINQVKAEHANLEIRLNLPGGIPCQSCAVEVSLIGSADTENVIMAGLGSPFSGSFARAVGSTPTPGDARLVHLATDSIVIRYTNPLTAQSVRRAYAFQGILPTVKLFHGGKEIDTVTAEHGMLEIQLDPGGTPCPSCVVEVSLVGSADKENVAMSGSSTPFIGSFMRDIGASPAPGDGKLVHLASDSIVIRYTNPLTLLSVRRAYLYIDFKNLIVSRLHNQVAKTTLASSGVGGAHWVISGAPNIQVQTQSGGICCEVVGADLKFGHADSSRYTGVVLEATREFQVDITIYTNIGQFVNQVTLTVPRSEFMKLPTVPGKDTRTMRLLWKGLTESGARAGTGAYIFHTVTRLLPVPGLVGPTGVTSDYKTLGLLRQ
jgi:von Willebrand factor type A domain